MTETQHCFKPGGLTHVGNLVNEALAFTYALDAIKRGISDDDANLATGMHFVINALEDRLNGLATALNICGGEESLVFTSSGDGGFDEHH